MEDKNIMWFIVDDNKTIFFNDPDFYIVKNEYYKNYDYYNTHNCFIDCDILSI